MSRAAKLTLAGTSLFALSTIIFVHYSQQAEKAVRFNPNYITSSSLSPNSPSRAGLGTVELILTQAMHQGVVRDVEQQRLKKERLLDFEMQKAMEEEYKKVQKVHDCGTALENPQL
jgi:protein PET117